MTTLAPRKTLFRRLVCIEIEHDVPVSGIGDLIKADLAERLRAEGTAELRK